MLGRIVEINSDGRHLSVKRGFLVISEKRQEVGRIPLDDIHAVVANAHGLTYSNNLLVALSERKAIFVVCGPNHCPVSILWPTEGHYCQASRMDAQISASRPLRKRLWKQLVQAKVAMQGAVLEANDCSGRVVTALISKVRSGDPDNIEAQAARRYWSLLFGKSFRRDRRADGVNSLLNYGYMILRSATARAVIGAGLHPTLGIHHQNRQNSMRLVDDLMEPFRPLVDHVVVHLAAKGMDRVDQTCKRALAELMYRDMPSEEGVSPVMACIQRLVGSLVKVYEGDSKALSFPFSPTRIDFACLLPEFVGTEVAC